MISFPAFLFVLLFTLAMVSLWFMPQRKWSAWFPWVCFSSALIVCLIQGWLQLLGLIWILLLVAAAYLLRLFDSGWRHGYSLIVVLVLSLALATHMLPGFYAIPVSAEAVYRNLDKACVAFVLLALTVPRMTQWRQLKRAFSDTWLLFFISPIVIFTLAWLTGGIHQAGFNAPQHLWLWVWGNLLVTCVAEELFFRGLLQRSLAAKWGKWKLGGLAALSLVSVLFGLAHIGGGTQFVLLAMVAGLFYGVAYYVSRRIEMAILLHFFINVLYVFVAG